MRTRTLKTLPTWLALLSILNLVHLCLAADKRDSDTPAKTSGTIEDDINKLSEPPFPKLFYDAVQQETIQPKRAKIVTEVIGSDYRRTNEEYLDLDLGRSAYLVQNNYGVGQIQLQAQSHQQVTLAIAQTDQLIQYRPYTCQTSAMTDPTVAGLDYWSINVNMGAQSVVGKNLRVFGLMAMWLYAAESPKTYQKSGMVYSASRNIYRLSHNWTVVDDDFDVNIKFFFISSTFNKDSIKDRSVQKQVSLELSLESIEIESRKTHEVLRTINVLSIDYELETDVYENIFEIPVGYGCETNIKVDYSMVEMDNANIKDGIATENEFWDKSIFTSSKLDLEITATKIDKSTSVRATDTIYYELAHLPMRVNQKDYDLMLTKIKSKEKEIKTIENRFYNVKYQIDMQKGSCRMSHITQADQDDTSSLLKFNNGLQLSLGKDELEMIFSNKEQFHLIKSTDRIIGPNKQVTHIYMEKTSKKWPYGKTGDYHRIAREIRTLVVESTKDADGQKSFSTSLESITIWVIDAETQLRIEEIYHLNVIDKESPLKPWPDVPRLFDVSQECYLDSEKMRSGYDYAWVQFFYPVASRQLDMLVDDEFKLKATIYQKLIGQYQLTSPRVPRLELMFGDEGLVVRALILDLPSLELLYNTFDHQVLELDKTKGDLMLIAADLKHCSKLCTMYTCRSMSLCAGSRACILGMDATELASVKKSPKFRPMKENAACLTLSNPYEDENKLEASMIKQRLHDLLSFISHQDYDTQDVPKLPDELTLPREESGLTSDADYKRFITAYMLDLTEYLTQKGNKAPTLIISLMISDHFVALLPARFTIENNPLDEFALPGKVIDSSGSDGGDQDNSDALYDSSKVVTYFHEGLSVSRFKFNAFQGPVRDKSLLLNGLNYDQCALGCLNSKCGTFSYCPSRKECIITPMNTINEASTARLIEEDGECFISQRDFVKNYQKYPNVQRPKDFYLGSTRVSESLSDCALKCLKQNGCLSFEYCQQVTGEPNAHGGDNGCYLQKERHPEGLFNTYIGKPISGSTISTHSHDEEPLEGSTNCDHYERSSLAEFNQIESRKVTDELLDQLKTTEYTGSLTPMDCADICLNQLIDCSAFQFCFDPSARTPLPGTKHALSCLMIQSKPSDAGEQKDFEVLIDDKDGQLTKASKYLEYNNQCHVFALRPDTPQAHLRDLAMGSTMTVEDKQAMDEMDSSSGFRLSWGRYIFLFLSLTISAVLLGVGVCYARERNEFVRDQLDRARYFVGL